jgi:hypothetical protein
MTHDAQTLQDVLLETAFEQRTAGVAWRVQSHLTHSACGKQADAPLGRTSRACLPEQTKSPQEG